ncbi:MAG: GldG family protein [Bdellovibrionota bacterium]
MRKLQRYAELLLVLLIAVLANVAAQRLFHRWDLTDDKRYTLSEASVKALKKLDDTLTIKAFFSENIPARYAPILDDARDTLDEFKAYGGANVQVEFIDPYDDPETEQEMRLLGIPELILGVDARDQIERLKVYMGVGIFYRDRKEVVQSVAQSGQAMSHAADFEYNLTSAILKITSDEPEGIGIWLGNPLPAAKTFWEDYQRYQLEEQLDPLYQALKRQYKVVEVDFGGGKPVPEQVNTLLVIGPRKASERDLYEIDQFIMRGGSVIFLLDVQEQDKQQPQALPVPTGLEPLLEHYGLKVRPSVVADKICDRAVARARYYQYLAPYVFWPQVAETGVDRTNPALVRIEAVTLPWTAAIEVATSNSEGKKFVPLLRSSNIARIHDLPASIADQQPDILPANSEEPVVLAGMVEGQLESYFNNRTPPAQAVPQGQETPRVSPSVKEPDFVGHTDSGRVVVVGSSTFVTGWFLSMMQQVRSKSQNLAFILNLVDWLSLGEDLIGMRARFSTARGLEPASEGAKQAIQYGNVLAVPVLVILYGLARFFLRRKDRRMYEERFRFHTRSTGAGLERKS